MSHVGRIVPLLILLVLGCAGRTEAALFDFGGAGKRGGIVHDGVEDVFTMNNACSGDCTTTELADFLTDFGVLITSGNLPNVSISAVHILLMTTTAPGVCGSLPDVDCTTLDDFEETMDAWNKGISGNTQPIIRLLTTNPSDPFFFTLTPNAATYLGSLDPAFLAGARLGIEVDFSTVDNTPFTAEIVSVNNVPEPGALALLGLGLAGVLRRRLNRRSA